MNFNKVKSSLVSSLVALTLVAFSPSLYAHGVTETSMGLSSGFLHPLLGMDHILAMLAVGLWAQQLSGRAQWQVPLIFVVTLLLGAGLLMFGLSLPVFEPVIMASLVALGLLIASKKQLPLIFAGSLVAVFALFHGYAHGSALAVSVIPASYFIGLGLSTVILQGLGMLTGYMLGNSKWIPASGLALVGSGLAMIAVY